MVGLALGLLPVDPVVIPIASKPELYESDLLSDDSVMTDFDDQEPVEAAIIEPNPSALKLDVLDSIESLPEESVDELVEDASEWPSLKLGVGEDVVVEEETDVRGVVEEVVSEVSTEQDVESVSDQWILQSPLTEVQVVSKKEDAIPLISQSKPDPDLIPGLPIVEFPQNQENINGSDEKSCQSNLPEKNSNPLGELRIKDDVN